MHTLTLLALSLFTGTVTLTNYSIALESQVTDSVQPQTVTQLPTTDIENIAREITVRVNAGEDRGSGILIAKDNDTYIVITNTRVTDRGDTYTIQTPDGMEHQATLVNSPEQNDLAVLEFSSSNSYTIATVGNSDSITEGETVIAAGFPDSEERLLVTEGAISLITQKPLNKGYAIGFTNETVQGMSGGALLNSNGEVIAILGKGQDAILNTAYDYMDSTTPTDEEIAAYRKASFSIPIANIANLSPQLAQLVPGSNPDIAQQPETESTPAPKPEYTGIVKTVDDIAEQITVRIDNTEKDVNGSGVIVAKQGNTYYGLTAKHVLCTLPSVIKPECEPNGTHQIVTNDGATHQIDYQTVEANSAWLDIAIFSFKSSNNYAVADIDRSINSDRWTFVSGFPKQNTGGDGKPARLLTGGRLFKEENEDFTAKDTSSFSQNKDRGQNSLLYTNISYGGMSGGAILNSHGKLIGINTGAENEFYFDEDGDYEEYSLGFSIGESITNVFGYLQANDTRLKENWLRVSKNTAPELNREEVVTIITQLLTTEKPTDKNLVDWMNYGNQQWRYRRYDEAINAFNKAISIDPNFDRAYYAIGLVNYRIENYHKAVAALQQAVQINSSPYFYWRYLGSACEKLKQWSEAIAAYDKAIENNQSETNKDFVLYLERGNILREKSTLSDIVHKGKLYQKAIASYNEAVEINPFHPGVYYNRGLLYKEVKEYEQAIADFSKTIEINPNYNYGKAYRNRGEIYAELKQDQLAYADKDKASQILRRETITLFKNVDIGHEELKEYEQSIAKYNEAIALNPNDAEAYFNRGNVYQESSQYQLAINDYDRAIAIDSNHVKAYYNRGNIYKNLKEYDRAIADYDRVITFDLSHAGAYSNRGDIYKEKEQYKLAIADYDKAIAINPNGIGAYLGLGAIYRKSGNIEKAITNYQKARQLAIAQNNSLLVTLMDNLLKRLERQEQNIKN